MNIIFMGSKPIGYRCLEILNENTNCKIIGVLTKGPEIDVWWDEKYRVYNLANRFDIPLLKLSDLENLDIDLIISIQFHKILTERILSLPKYGGVNLHMAPLPEYRGCNQFSFAIINEENEFGTTLHYMSTKIDGGDIIAQKRFPIEDDIAVTELYKKTEEYSVQLFRENINSIILQRNKRVPQAEIKEIAENHFYQRKDIEAVKQIDLNWSKRKIDKYIRALDFPPFEPPYTLINNKKIYLTYYQNRIGK